MWRPTPLPTSDWNGSWPSYARPAIQLHCPNWPASPNRKTRITASAAIQVVFPVFGRQSRSERSVLLAHDQIKEITKQCTVLDGSREARVRRYRSGAISDQKTKITVHQFKAAPDQVSQAFRRRWTAGLKDVPLEETGVPLLLIGVSEQQNGNDPALRHLE